MYWFGVRCHIVYDMNNIILFIYKRNFMVTSNIRVREIVTKFSKLDIT